MAFLHRNKHSTVQCHESYQAGRRLNSSLIYLVMQSPTGKSLHHSESPCGLYDQQLMWKCLTSSTGIFFSSAIYTIQKQHGAAREDSFLLTPFEENYILTGLHDNISPYSLSTHFFLKLNFSSPSSWPALESSYLISPTAFSFFTFIFICVLLFPLPIALPTFLIQFPGLHNIQTYISKKSNLGPT